MDQILGAYSFVFYLMGLVAVYSFRQMNSQVEDLTRKEDEPISINSVSKTLFVIFKLKKWKQQYHLVYKYVDELNKAFNLALLVDICFIFITVINELVDLTIGFAVYDFTSKWLGLISVAQYVFFLSIIIMTGDKINYEVCIS